MFAPSIIFYRDKISLVVSEMKHADVQKDRQNTDKRPKLVLKANIMLFCPVKYSPNRILQENNINPDWKYGTSSNTHPVAGDFIIIKTGYNTYQQVDLQIHMPWGTSTATSHTRSSEATSRFVSSKMKVI
jgi:hypothetical protein